VQFLKKTFLSVTQKKSYFFIPLMSDHCWNIAVLFGHQFPLSTSTNLKVFNAFFTNKIHGCTFLLYHQRLHKLSLHSLHHRRIVNDIVTIHSINSGCISIPLSPSICLIPPSITRGHNLQITIPILRYSAILHFQNWRSLERFACLTPLYTISN